MKKLLYVLSFLGLFIATTAFSRPLEMALEGKWLGEITGNAGVVPFQTHFWIENNEIKGTIDFPQEKVFGLELSWIVIESSSVHFEVTKNSGTLIFEGKLLDNKLAGKCLTKADRGTFDLSRML